MSDTETWTWNLSTAELAATQAKLEKLNNRSAKKGLNGGSLSLEVIRTVESVEEVAGFEVTTIWHEVAIHGTAPKFNGWNFIATLDFDPAVGLVTRTVPGYEGKIDRSNLQAQHCDHCNTDRYRKATYLVQHDDGTTKQVGSSCVKDFLGAAFSPVFISEELKGWREDEGGFGRRADWDYDVATVLAVAWAAVTEYGFVKASAGEYGEDVPTKARILQVLGDLPSDWRAKQEALEVRAKLQPLAEQAKGQAKLIRDFILSDSFNGDSEYVVNLKTVAAAERISAKHFGLLASAPQAWARSVERDLKRQAERAELKNEFFGEVKDKVELTVRVKSIRGINGQYGSTALYTLVTDDGHLVKWFSSNWGLGEEVNNHSFRIKATIKGHDEYNGTKSTVITRAKVLEDIAPAV